MLTTDTAAPVRRALTETQILAALLEVTGDLDTAQTLQQTLPTWLTGAAPAILAALDRDVRELQTSQSKFQLLMQALTPLDSFCATQLSASLNDKWPGTYDVERDVLELPGFDCGCEGSETDTPGVEKVATVRRSLLQAAMQNFTDEEVIEGGFPEGSAIRITAHPPGITGLTPQSFAQRVRELDLGQKYQDHLRQVFDLPSTAVGLVNEMNRLKALQLRVDAHLAYLKGHIKEPVYKTLLTLNIHSGTGTETGIKNIVHGSDPLILQGMQLFDTCVWGVVIFSKRSVQTYPTEWCVVYMPNEPGRPLYEYDTFAEFKLYLSLKLQVKSYKDYFANSIEEDRKLEFFKSFTATPNLDTFKQLPISVPLFQFMVQSSLGKLQIDARSLAVPTADVDEEVRRKRLENYLELGLTVANIGAFFVPVLGQLMMGVTVGQLLGEVYDGVQDWRHGDQQEAMAHLLSVAENLAMMGAFALGGTAAAAMIKKTVREHSAFFSQFQAITDSEGKPRLWKTDMAGYRDPGDRLGAEAVADAQGLYDVNGVPFVRLDGNVYAIHYDPAIAQWRVRHPALSHRYSPVLTHNGEGGWRLSHEQPHEWTQGSYGLKRLVARWQQVEEHRVEMLRRITGTPVSQVQHLAEENQALPARVKDSLRRFELERRIARSITAMEHGDPRSSVHAPEQLQTLPDLPGWPAGRYIKVLDDRGATAAVYPKGARTVNNDLSVEVTAEQLRKGELLSTVIEGLYQRQIDAMLGSKAVNEGESDALAKKLAAALKTHRRAVFERVYQAEELPATAEAALLRTAFPALPTEVAESLLSQASSVERLRLRSTRRVPLALAHNAREAHTDLRLDRAITGLYLPDVASADSEKLALGLLPRLSGWDPKLQLELREGSVTGTLLHGMPAQDGATRRIIVKSATGYEAYGSAGQSLAPAKAGPQAFYQTLLQALPAQQRTAMGLGNALPEEASKLRSQLLGAALEERDVSRRLLTGQPLLDTSAALSCLQADSPAPTSTHPRALVRKVLKLYPLMSEAQATAFLDGLGSDHLTRATRVRQCQQQLQKLRGLLKTWRNDDADMRTLPGDLNEYRQSRRQVADAIENSWRRLVLLRGERGVSVPGLSLDGMRIGKLPILPTDIDFSHIERVSMKNMEQGNDLAYFIKHFSQAQSMELDSNKLTLLPEALSLMPRLKHLSLADNQLRLTEHTLVKLAALRTLERLNLSKNPLGGTPDVGKLFDLKMLALRDTRATELPKGLARLLYLDHVDLRNNEITTLPEWLFSVPKSFSETLNLRTNPLASASRIKLKAYRDRVGVGMGYLEDDIARINEQEAKRLWLPQELSVTYSQRGALWNQLKDDPGADGLFHLLAELGNTADAEYVREDMTRRVWSVLEGAKGDTALREQLFDLAANPINCTDTAAMNFSNLEVALEVDKVVRASATAQSAAGPLLRLSKGLFRLDQLKKVADEHCTLHPEADPLQVELAYRTGLADVLELPGQPQHMRYASLGAVTAQDRALAQVAVQRAELSPALLEFTAGRSFWVDFLKRQYPTNFSKLNEPFQARFQNVFDQASTLKDEDYRARLGAIKVEHAAAEQRELQRLTQEVMKFVDLGICMVGGS